MTSPKERAAVVILNWNRTQLTLNCLESVLKLENTHFRIFLVDNHSEISSLQSLRRELDFLASCHALSFKQVLINDMAPWTQNVDENADLVLLCSNENKGFGGGVNLGLRSALEDPTLRFFWILNNDTLAMPGAFQGFKRVFDENSRLGIVGSTLCYLDRPDVIQAVGGQYNPWLGTSRHVLEGSLYDPDAQADHQQKIDYAVGASLCIRREVLEAAGLFPEDYFLYFEDLDWAYRVRKTAPEWQTGYALESLVLHQEGGSTGANQSQVKKTTLLADYFYQRNRLRFARRWHPFRYPLVHLTQILVLINRLKRRQWQLAGIALGLFLGWVPTRLKPRLKSD
jgi:GT2 family glycosyltransferase